MWVHNHFKKCYVNVGAQPLSIKATKFPKWMWVYNNFKKLQNCKINVGVQDKAILSLWYYTLSLSLFFISFVTPYHNIVIIRWCFIFIWLKYFTNTVIISTWVCFIPNNQYVSISAEENLEDLRYNLWVLNMIMVDEPGIIGYSDIQGRTSE